MSENSSPPRLTLIDGSGFIFRAFYALPGLTRSDGTPSGAVYGFVNMLLKLLDERLNDGVEDHVAVIFDAGRHTFRNDLYADYKANRDEPPEDLRPQFALVRDATAAMGLPSIELAGFEADDLIASYTRAGQMRGFQVDIVSSDKDLMQLVDDNANIRMVDAMKDKVIDEAAVEEKFAVSPGKVLDVLSLMGDSSDNVPGVPGIGPKTAAQLIHEYGDLDSLLANAESIKQKKRREMLIEHAEAARLSRELITLKEDVPLPEPLEDLILKPRDVGKLVEFLQLMEFKKLVTRVQGGNSPDKSLPPLRGEVRACPGPVPGRGGDSSSEASNKTSSQPRPPSPTLPLGGGGSYALITSESALNSLLAQAKARGYLALSLESEGENLTGIAFSLKAGEGHYLPLNHLASAAQDDLFEPEAKRQPGQMAGEDALQLLAPLLADPSILKIGWRSKEDMQRLASVMLAPIDDVTLISYCLGGGLGSHSFADVVERELGTSLLAPESLLGKGRNKISFALADYNDARDHAAQKADFTLRLWQWLKPRLIADRLTTPYERLERPLVPILAQMQRHGICVDRERLHRLSKEFRGEQDGLAKEIYALAGKEFTLGSPKQLGEVLFDHLGIQGGKKSKKSGQYSTGAEVLEELAAQGHTIAEKVLSWRQYDKLRNTYTEALEKQINPVTGRVHTTFQQTVAATGRLSSTDPNLQNIPIRTDQGRRIRKAFVAAEGYSLMAADYSQIELRLLAEMAEIDVLKEAFRNQQDIHTTTASQMFRIPPEEVTSELRRKAKTINFGIIYGISAHGLAVRLGIERGEAADFINAYFEHYPGIRRYMEAKKQEAREQGYVTSLFGRRIHIPNIQQKNFNLRAFAERQAINAPLQGTAADIIKRAMVGIARELNLSHWERSKSHPQDGISGEGLQGLPDNSKQAVNSANPHPKFLPAEDISTSPTGRGNDIRLLLQVHDELVFEIKKGMEDHYAPIIKQAMEQAAHLSIPLTVETGIGHDWGEVH
jgi:DNA polymerase-1